MSQTAGHAGARPRGARQHSIGEVLTELQPQFPDLSHSKVRFLEERGLVEPTRTPAGYRKFTPADVERLRLVLGLQRDHDMSLRRIAEYLDALDRGLEPPALPGGPPRVPRVVHDGDAPVDTGAVPAAALRLRRGELLEATSCSEQLLGELEGYGLLSVGAVTYDGHDLEVVRTAVELAAFGIEPRHLRAFRSSADRELGLADQVVSPLRHHRSAGSSARAEEVVREIAGLCLRLHGALLRSALERRSS